MVCSSDPSICIFNSELDDVISKTLIPLETIFAEFGSADIIYSKPE